ncbi:MAG: hypothetical protein WCF22_22115, partial [Candidatus Sulfotelmatobacter sp.]
FAVSASRESIDMMLKSSRVMASAETLKSLRSNPYLKPDEAATLDKILKPEQLPSTQSASALQTGESAQGAKVGDAQASAEAQHKSSGDGEDVPDEAVSAYLVENAAEIAVEQTKPFQPVGGVVALFAEDDSAGPENKEVQADSSAGDKASASTSAGAAAKPARTKPPEEAGRRDNTLQKIKKLDVKGRIQLALKGSKEERSILIRDGTKVVALAVLEAPKLSDGEVERFALQKNVLEAVLRQIPLKRRFMKNYIVVRNLVSNPRTPLDLGLGLMKHLLAQDLKNISANKEVSETVRKLALKMYKQKVESANKK